MLEIWNRLEPITKIIMLVIIVGVLVFGISLYKIIKWFQSDAVSARLAQYRAQRQATVFYPSYWKVSKIRLVWFCIAFTVYFVVLAYLVPALPKLGKMLVPLVGLIPILLVNNLLVSRFWQCPVCGVRLPCLIGRSSLRPKWVDTCPSCGYGGTATNTSLADHQNDRNS